MTLSKETQLAAVQLVNSMIRHNELEEAAAFSTLMIILSGGQCPATPADAHNALAVLAGESELIFNHEVVPTPSKLEH